MAHSRNFRTGNKICILVHTTLVCVCQATYCMINYATITLVVNVKQEAQLMVTNLRDAFSDQSKSPNIIPFHMLGIVSSCAIVTLSSRGAVFMIFDFKKCHNLVIGVRGHSRSLKVVPFKRLCMVSY